MMNLSKERFSTAIVIITYNRPNLLQKVLEVVKKVSPQTIYLIVDGVKENDLENEQKNREVKKILDDIDWCENIHRNYAQENLGCGIRIPTGLDWVFSQEEKAIILEDDCLPEISFFYFCQELLDYYQDDNQVTQICGTNRLLNWQQDKQSYHFARYGSAWGWATWRSAWQYYQHHQTYWQDKQIRSKIEKLINNQEQYNYFCQRYQTTLNNQKITWDYQWSLVQLAHSGKSIIPAVNLIKNLGFNLDATHTKHFCLSHLLQKTIPMNFPLSHPLSKEYDDEYDNKHFAWSIGKPEEDSLMTMINVLIDQKKLVYALLVVNQAIVKYPQYQPLKDTRKKILHHIKQTEFGIRSS